MSLVAFARRLPQDLQFPMLEFAEALEEDLRAKLAVRREDVEALQATVRDLAEAQKRTEQRVEELAEAQKRTEQRVEELAEAQKRTEQRLDRLEAVVAELIEAQKRTEQRVEELAAAQKRTEEILQKLIVRVDRIEVKLSGLIGDNLERKYREKAFAYLGQILRPVQSVSLQDLLPRLEERLSEAEVDDLLPLDLLLRGRVRRIEGSPEIWLAMEVSATVDKGDVERAVHRARLLNKAGLPTIAAVAGEEITNDASRLAAQEKVLVMLDGRRAHWEDALDAVLASGH
ncbi:MAG: hypothetical protein ACP5UQ_04630 [Anaerolineae bacterium]